MGHTGTNLPSSGHLSKLQHFHWLADTVAFSDGIHLLTAVKWHTHDTDVVVHCDASLTSLGFVITQSRLSFCTSIPLDAPLNTIFFYEALCIVSVILWASELPRQPCHLLIYTDSLNTMEMFNSFCASAGYNELLLFAMCILITMKI